MLKQSCSSRPEEMKTRAFERTSIGMKNRFTVENIGTPERTDIRREITITSPWSSPPSQPATRPHVCTHFASVQNYHECSLVSTDSRHRATFLKIIILYLPGRTENGTARRVVDLSRRRHRRRRRRHLGARTHTTRQNILHKMRTDEDDDDSDDKLLTIIVILTSECKGMQNVGGTDCFGSEVWIMNTSSVHELRGGGAFEDRFFVKFLKFKFNLMIKSSLHDIYLLICIWILRVHFNGPKWNSEIIFMPIWWNLVFALLSDVLTVQTYRKRVQILKQLYPVYWIRSSVWLMS